MKMSDKELDQLFNSQLTDLEVEPSAAVWDRIATDIKAESSDKKGAFPYMQIAAGIIVLMAVGLYFMPKHETVSLHGAYNGQQVLQAVVKPVETVNTLTAEREGTTSQRPKLIRHIIVNPVVHATYAQVKSQVDTQKYIASVQKIDKPEVIKTVDNPVINTLTTGAKTDVITKQPARVLATADIPRPAATETVKKRRIHTLGDILNVVIAKVDKRDNKIIEFSNDDDDESFTVTGVNLGPIKVKKQN
jgi:hypothetical protein